jgi:predicted MPP superfamily phosphohydrolase
MWLTTIIVVAASLLVVSAYAFAVEPRWLRVRHRVLRLHTWDPSLNGVRVLHISDLHVGHDTQRMARFLRQASQIEADVTVITGDFVANPTGVEEVGDVLREITSTRTVFGILGNHEYRYHTMNLPRHGRIRTRHHFDSRAVMRVLEDAGMVMLANSSLSVQVRGATLNVVGLDDRLSEADDIDVAFEGIDGVSRVLMLCHTPDILDDAAERDLPIVLSGHTHGGQVFFVPWFLPTFVTELPLRRPRGLLRRGRTVLHLSPGLATTALPFRLLVRPEVTVLELRGPEESARTEEGTV